MIVRSRYCAYLLITRHSSAPTTQRQCVIISRRNARPIVADAVALLPFNSLVTMHSPKFPPASYALLCQARRDAMNSRRKVSLKFLRNAIECALRLIRIALRHDVIRAHRVFRRRRHKSAIKIFTREMSVS